MQKPYCKMKQAGLIILSLLLIYSCKDNPTKNNKSQTVIPTTKKLNADSLIQTIVQTDNKESTSNAELLNVFTKAIDTFPNDSASLYRFYFKWNSTKDQNKINRQIARLEKLTSKESIERYRSIEKNLLQLLFEIANSNTVSKLESDSLVKLYSDFDYFSGESLFSQLISTDENYKLVWDSFKIMIKESSKDTCFISGFIKLDNNIRTNVELAEAMQNFKVQAIKNNPLGFLEMYSQRKVEQRANFANNISVWDDPDKELIEKYSEISKTALNENNRQLAAELIQRFNN